MLDQSIGSGPPTPKPRTSLSKPAVDAAFLADAAPELACAQLELDLERSFQQLSAVLAELGPERPLSDAADGADAPFLAKPALPEAAAVDVQHVELQLPHEEGFPEVPLTDRKHLPPPSVQEPPGRTNWGPNAEGEAGGAWRAVCYGDQMSM